MDKLISPLSRRETVWLSAWTAYILRDRGGSLDASAGAGACLEDFDTKFPPEEKHDPIRQG